MTRCDAGTPMGDLLRQYWIPAVRSDELPGPDCPPLRIRLLNEDLIAFRASSGKVGLVDDACPHRGASMFYGRNEEGGLRCVYHGWKFDISGQCVEMMSEPAESNFTSKVKILAYPTQERNGIIWAYMGPRAVPPSLPELEANMVVDGEPKVQTILNPYNWLQAMENNIDTSHAGILHWGAMTPEYAKDAAQTPMDDKGDNMQHVVVNRAPRFVVRDADFGMGYGAWRPAGEDGTYWRTMNWLWPFYTMSPANKLGTVSQFVATVPVDDYHNMQWSMTRVLVDDESVRWIEETSGNRNTLPNTSDWLGRFRNHLTEDIDIDFGIDRQVQHDKPATVQGWTGLKDIYTQDEVMKWSQGRARDNGIVRRDREHLGTTDSAIIRVRRLLLDAAKTLRDHGTVPPCVDNPEIYRQRSGWVVLPKGVDFWEGARPMREAFKDEPVPMAVTTS
jgi:phenylpropionate dioxygenase-like ring-hydroxylating dioxygenase large terminal subunit